MAAPVTPPRLVACYFAGPRDGSDAMWRRLAAVLRLTAARHCPRWALDLTELPTPSELPGHRLADVANTQKLEHWARVIEHAADEERILLVDADVAIIRSLDPIWDRPFDLAYTVKPPEQRVSPHPEFPFNAGVIALRVNPITRWFMARWATENLRLFHDKAAHTPLRARYGGMNQAALGSLLEQGAFTAAAMRVLELPCLEWNCEESAWSRFDPRLTRILHNKGALRAMTCGTVPVMPERALTAAREAWLALDGEARAIERLEATA